MIQRVYYDDTGLIFQLYVGNSPDLQIVTAFGYLDVPITTSVQLGISRVVNGEIVN